MTREEAILIIKNKYPNKYIYSGFELDDQYVFIMSVDSKKMEDDMMQYGQAVNKETKEISFFNIRLFFLEIATGKRPDIPKGKRFLVDE